MWAVCPKRSREISHELARSTSLQIISPSLDLDLSGTEHRCRINEVDGVVLAFDRRGLVSLARNSNCLIELVPEVGDFVAAGDPLFRILTVATISLRNAFTRPSLSKAQMSSLTISYESGVRQITLLTIFRGTRFIFRGTRFI